MLVQRTEKGRAELKPGVRTLGQRERSVLLLADGNKSIGDLSTLFEDQGTQIALGLMREGYLELRRPSGA
ncbi:MAG TPA: hypothetical protein VLJ58_01720, partial [Ramlibacter sp.]|nr:hypothetical protein [Ramlibacter sp.]